MKISHVPTSRRTWFHFCIPSSHQKPADWANGFIASCGPKQMGPVNRPLIHFCHHTPTPSNSQHTVTVHPQESQNLLNSQITTLGFTPKTHPNLLTPPHLINFLPPKIHLIKNIKQPKQISGKKSHTSRPFSLSLISLSSLIAFVFVIWYRKVVTMSGLIDMWTEQLAKIRNKGSTDLASGSSSTAAESSQVVQPKERSGTLIQWPPNIANALPKISSTLAYSEASLSMLVECFSPWWKTSCNLALISLFCQASCHSVAKSWELCFMK